MTPNHRKFYVETIYSTRDDDFYLVCYPDGTAVAQFETDLAAQNYCNFLNNEELNERKIP